MFLVLALSPSSPSPERQETKVSISPKTQTPQKQGRDDGSEGVTRNPTPNKTFSLSLSLTFSRFPCVSLSFLRNLKNKGGAKGECVAWLTMSAFLSPITLSAFPLQKVRERVLNVQACLAMPAC